VKLLSFDNFDRRSDVVRFQPVLTQHDWEYVQESIAEHRQLSCNLSSTDYAPHDYWVSYVNRSGSQSEPSVLFVLFHPTEGDSNPVLYHFSRLPGEDWKWLGGESYDELSAEEFVAICNKRRI
jgi:hypothetical protein